jgi:parallel beta-helix repeat protein
MIVVNSARVIGRSICVIQIALLVAGCYSGALLADSTANCRITPPIPAVPSTAKTYSHRSGTDDTAGIQQALDGLQTGDWLVLPAGTYNISQHLTVLASGVTLYGAGATIHSSSATDGAIWIKSDNVAVYGFTLQQDSKSRQSTPWAGGISVYDDRGAGSRTVRGAVIQNNTVNNSAAVGIFILNVENFTVANNTVWRSWADGIHMTGGAFSGRVINNTVSQNGDDMIAVVSYASSPKPAPAALNYANWPAVQAGLDRNIYIAGNSVSNQYWGRGISVVGGSYVTIANNNVSLTPGAAGIYLARETAYMTFGDHNILVSDNTVSQIETTAPSYQPVNNNMVLSGQGAIEVASTMYSDEYANPTWRQAFSMSDIAVLNNSVSHTQFAGIRLGLGSSGSGTAKASDGSTLTQTWLPGPVQNLTVKGNNLAEVKSAGVIDAYSGLDATTISCSDNTLNGVPWTTKCTSTVTGSSATATVSGASVQCTANGILDLSVSPKVPTLVPVN